MINPIGRRQQGNFPAPAVLFNEGLQVPVVRQPAPSAGIRTGILHEALEFHARLVVHGGDAELEPA